MQEDYTAPLPIQAFCVSLFLVLGVAVDRSIGVVCASVLGGVLVFAGVVGPWQGIFNAYNMYNLEYVIGSAGGRNWGL